MCMLVPITYYSVALEFVRKNTLDVTSNCVVGNWYVVE